MNLQRILEEIRRKIALQIGRFVLLATDGSGVDELGRAVPQRVSGKIFAGEDELQGVPHLQGYGVSARPHPGAEGIALQVGGSRSRLVVICFEDPRHRPTGLQEGEVAIYSDERVAIHLKRGDELELRAAQIDSKADTLYLIQGATIALGATSLVTIGGSGVTVNILGSSVTLGNATTIDGRVFLNHTHSGVTTGPGNTGPVV